MRDTIHIVGLGLDFSEVDLWWLLLNKWRRGSRVSGKTYFYDLNSDVGRKRARNSLLGSFGVTLISVTAASYEEGYDQIYSIINRKVQLPEEPLFSIEDEPTFDEEFFTTNEHSSKSPQAEMDFGARKRSRKDRG
ncbi:MAG: hypothetical protein NTY41_06080 [Proteobacteria bacterium]|nr:hypothetical protein [Pseudomonadota bacterium]